MIKENIEKAVATLNKGELVSIPTETVYGLAANAFSESAVKKIFELKKRPSHNPLIVHIHDIGELDKIACNINEKAVLLAKKFWPGPLTLILDKHPDLPSIVTSGNKEVAVRIPNHPLTLNLLSQLSFPLAAPSANPFGSISPTSSEHVFNYFGHEIEVILEGGICVNGLESTIIGFQENQPILYRLGAIPAEEIELEIGPLKYNVQKDKNPTAPGMLSRHYAPKTDMYLTNNVEELINSFPTKKIGVLVFSESIVGRVIEHEEILSPAQNMEEAAKNLYAALHRLDQKKVDIIIAELMPKKGLGNTINDRLKRAIKKI